MIRLVIASLIGTAFYFLFGWLIFEGLLGEFMSNNTCDLPGFRNSDEESGIAFLILSCAAYAVLLVMILGVWTKTYTFGKGTTTGAITGILIAIMADTYWYGTTHFFNSIAPMLADICAAGLTVGLTGGIVAFTLGYKRRA